MADGAPRGRHQRVSAAAGGGDRSVDHPYEADGRGERFPLADYFTLVSFSTWRNQVGVSSCRPPSAVVSTVARRPSRAMSDQA